MVRYLFSLPKPPPAWSGIRTLSRSQFFYSCMRLHIHVFAWHTTWILNYTSSHLRKRRQKEKPTCVHSSSHTHTTCACHYATTHHIIINSTKARRCTAHKVSMLLLIAATNKTYLAKRTCSTRFRSEDLWVMSPTRFLCATEQSHFQEKDYYP